MFRPGKPRHRSLSAVLKRAVVSVTLRRMPPAARVGDNHVCPMVDPGPKPHVGGPIIPPCEPTVIIGNMPAARISDMAICVGPTDIIMQGSSSVIIGNMPAARMGDMTMHGGVIVVGCPTVIIGG